MKAYKVVKDDRYGIRSARCGAIDYKIGKWISAPNGTRLFVFEEFRQACHFAQIGESIYECLIEDAVSGNGCYFYGDQSEFWRQFKEAEARGDVLTNFKAKSLYGKDYPMTNYDGVLLAKKVKLLKKVG